MLHGREKESLKQFKKGIENKNKRGFLWAGVVSRWLGKDMEGLLLIARGGYHNTLEKILENTHEHDIKNVLKVLENAKLSMPGTNFPCMSEENLYELGYLAKQLGQYKKTIECWLKCGHMDYAFDTAKEHGLEEYAFSLIYDPTEKGINESLKKVEIKEVLPVIGKYKSDYIRITYYIQKAHRANWLGLSEKALELEKKAAQVILDNPNFIPFHYKHKKKKEFEKDSLPKGCPHSGKEYEFDAGDLEVNPAYGNLDWIFHIYSLFDKDGMFEQGAKVLEGYYDEEAMKLYESAGNLEKALELCEKINYGFWKAKDLSEKLGKKEKAAIYSMVRK
ncbi:hypothetical protein GOV06_01875 [Candidatus Woesearchaeota archaeon]|nr:hypothetical protein [Candidatus Woesearchaeota archaeon]